MNSSTTTTVETTSRHPAPSRITDHIAPFRQASNPSVYLILNGDTPSQPPARNASDTTPPHAPPPAAPHTTKKKIGKFDAYEIWINGDTKGARRMRKVERGIVITYRAVRKVMPRMLAP